MKKGMFITILVTKLMLLVAACGGNKVDDATAEKYITQAEEIVALLNEQHYEEIYAKFNDEMKAGLPVEDMEELTPIIEESGNFKEMDKASVEEEDGRYVTVLVGKYSNENRVFTITFNNDDEIAGLFIK